MEERNIVELTITRGSNGFGIYIKGGTDQALYQKDDGVFVSKIKETANIKDGKLEKGDKILELNGKSLENLKHSEVLNMFKRAGREIKLKIRCGAEETLVTSQRTDMILQNDEHLSNIIKKELGMKSTQPAPVVEHNIYVNI